MYVDRTRKLVRPAHEKHPIHDGQLVPPCKNFLNFGSATTEILSLQSGWMHTCKNMHLKWVGKIAEFAESAFDPAGRVPYQYKNSSGDEIANVNFLRRYRTYVLQNTKKENLLRLTN